MKVIILTEGGESIGFGHITRCVAMCQAFEESGITPEFIANGDKSITYLLKGVKEFRLLDWLNNPEDLKRIVAGADTVVVDSYLADLEFYRSLSGSVKLPVYIDDFKRLDYPRGVLVNGSIEAASIDYPVASGLTYLLGAKYAAIRREFWDVPVKNINGRPVNLLMIFGNNRSIEMVEEFLRLLNEKYPDLAVNIAGGIGLKRLKLAKQAGRVRFFYDADAATMKQLMTDSDMAFSAGGQVLNELARVGVPSVAMAVAENQLNNIRGWQGTGFLEYAGWWQDDKIFQSFQEKLGFLEPMEERAKRSGIGRSNIDGQGARRIVAFLTGHKN